MRHFFSLIIAGTMIAWLSSALATGPYSSAIKKLQVTDVGSAYNTVFLTLDITDSNCSSTNTSDRFTIVNSAQHSTILAALMANKPIIITGTGTCNVANIEEISTITISP